MSSKNIFHGNGNRRRFSCRISEQGSCGGGDNSSAIRLAYQRRTRNTHDQRSRRTAPNTHADSGGPAPQGRAAVPGTCPGRSRYSFVPSTAAIQKATGSLLEGSVPLGTADGWGGSSGRSTPFVSRSRSGGGREDVGMAKAKPVILGQRYADPALVSRPTGGPRPVFATTAVEIDDRFVSFSPVSGHMASDCGMMSIDRSHLSSEPHGGSSCHVPLALPSSSPNRTANN